MPFLRPVALGACLSLIGAPPAFAVQQVEAPAQAAEAAPAEVEERFFIEAYDVVGNTLLDQLTIEKAVLPYVGPDRTVADVRSARDALIAAYRAAGFQAVDINPEPQGTVIVFNVVETPVGSVRVEGNRYVSDRRVMALLPSLAAGRPANFTAFTRESRQLQRMGLVVEPEIEDDPATPGSLDLVLRVEEEPPVAGAVTLTNDRSPNTSDLRLLANVRLNHLWGVGHSASVSYFVAPQRREDSEVWVMSYVMPIVGSDFTVTVFSTISNSDVAVLGGTNVVGDGVTVGVRGLYVLPPQGAWYQTAEIGLSYSDLKEDTLIEGADVLPAPIRYVPLALGYTARRTGNRSSLGATLGLTLGLRAFNDTVTFPGGGGATFVDDAFNNRRAFARENFVHANLDVDWTRELGDQSELSARVSAQLANGPLVSNEQFSVGGFSSVRGYLASEAVGDDGIAGALEFVLPNLGAQIAGWVTRLRPYAFADAGHARVQQALADQDNAFTLFGMGAGLRAELFETLSGDVAVAVPLLEGTETSSGDVRVHFSVRGGF